MQESVASARSRADPAPPWLPNLPAPGVPLVGAPPSAPTPPKEPPHDPEESRHSRLIAQSGEECITITLQNRGTASLTQDGREVLANPGTFTCSDTGRPFRREHPDDFRFTWFGVPKKELGLSDTDLPGLRPSHRLRTVRTLADRAGHDINYLALSGALEPLGPPDGPRCRR
ncbi:hypothetical protein [Streptomyces sp. NPDC096132]|uniref:AraC-like ligand-binding domain-containing protein n=1 Tax=Streptomyces sp. NPDC096132 TaxID=3366075 RepID=UPI0037FA6259